MGCQNVKMLNAIYLPLSPEHVRMSSPVEFAHDYLYPEARNTVSFGLDGQEAWPSTAYSELMDVLLRGTEKLSIDWPDEPRESQLSTLDEWFLRGPNSRPGRRKCTFFSKLHQMSFANCIIMRSPDPGNSLLPPASLTRQLLTSPT